MARIKRTPLARRDLKEIGRYLARESQSLDVALRFLDAIGKKCEIYARDPELAEACPDLGQNIRRFAVGNYLIFLSPNSGRNRGSARVAWQSRHSQGVARTSLISATISANPTGSAKVTMMAPWSRNRLDRNS